jgi:tRNA U34 5-methylaminomethyl-2-thiouridine-forming methyltransferase MnmC
MIEPRIQVTLDGSHTLFIPEMDEHYHSVNGAKQESMHVYIEAGFNQCEQEHISVLEFGFGTGLNALLTCMEAERRKIHTVYTTLEKYPLSFDIIHQLNYAEGMEAGASTYFQSIHLSAWEELILITPFFSLQKIKTDFSLFDFPGKYDVIYYDAFAPDKQSGVWSQEIFNRLFDSTNENGILTTYCAKGIIRRMLQSAGFKTERIPGPPGKREMLRGRKK